MIQLDPKYQTVESSTFNGVTVVTTTDTLFVSSVRIDFTTGALYATIEKGTGTPFASNLPTIQVTVNPDGTFTSLDSFAQAGDWTGTVAGIAALVAQLKTTFDNFVLSAGVVTGKAI